MKDRDKKIGVMAGNLSIDGFTGGGSFSNESVRHFVSEVNEQMDKKRNQIEKEKVCLSICNVTVLVM